MASIVRKIIVDASPESVWATVGDFAGGAQRIAPGVFVDCRVDEDDVRALTFADGKIVRERLIARDELNRRIVWGWLGDEVTHDNASMQVFAECEGRSRLVWIHDTLPDELGAWLAAAMDQLVPVFQQNLATEAKPT